MKTGGQLIIAALEAQSVERVFCVPGESYLAVLDALHDSPIQTVVARHESGAAIMAEATGKLSGRPGVAIVTRGPGATNASAGVHIAQQDSTPMLLLIGQIDRSAHGRDAFQEIDYRQLYGGMAKWVAEIDSAARIPEMIARAFSTAMSGRPGPVVLALPEDMLTETTDVAACRRVEAPEPGPSGAQMEWFKALLSGAEHPFAILGGSRWSNEAVRAMHVVADRWALPVGCSFRRQMLFDHEHPNYAGDVGLGINPKLRARIAEADLLLLIGGRMSEIPSQGYALLDIPTPRQKLIHIHPGPEELGRVYTPTLAINATPGGFLSAALEAKPAAVPRWASSPAEAHAQYLDWSESPPRTPGDVQMSGVMRELRARLPQTAIITNGAGNYATWLHRFHRFRRYRTQLAPTSGSMGYGLPAAIAAKLRHPAQPVICFAGDGCFQMTCQEFGTAVQTGAAVIVVLIDNGIYGAIRMHQEREYPGRVSGTDLRNPDFAALARAYGGHGETVTATAQFSSAFDRASASGLPAIVHVKLDPEALTPDRSLSQIRDAPR